MLGVTRQIALLRGINLARSRRVAMADLRELLAAHGYGDVRTHLQSGNVLLSSDLPPDRLADEVREAMAARFGMEIPVIVRTRDELAAVVERDPLRDVVDDPRRYQVNFLAAEPDPEAVRGLEAHDLLPERVAVVGREAYAWHANGIQRSPLAKLLSDGALGVTATARNWNTVTKLLELAEER
jgi:uncharacterized protein (DUF1697 family)